MYTPSVRSRQQHPRAVLHLELLELLGLPQRLRCGGVLWQQHGVDAWQNTSLGDRGLSQKRIQLLVVSVTAEAVLLNIS
jgi:hypothetical protein